MEQAITPHMQLKSADTFFASVCTRLKYFVRATITRDDDKEELTGQPALRHLWGQLKERAEKDEQLTLEDLEIFQVHKYMLDEAQQTELSGFVRDVLATATPTGAKDSADTQDSKRRARSPTKSKPSQAAQSMQTSKANVLKFFKP